MSETCCTQLGEKTTQKWRKKSPSGHHHTTLSGYIFATKAFIDNRKKMLNGNMYSIWPQNILNFSLLTAEICWRVWGTPANLNGFRILASLLQRRCSTEVDEKSVHYVRLYPGLVYCIYIFGSSCPLMEFCHVQNSLCVQLRIIAQVCWAISSELRHVSTIGKKLVKQQYFLHMSW